MAVALSGGNHNASTRYGVEQGSRPELDGGDVFPFVRTAAALGGWKEHKIDHLAKRVEMATGNMGNSTVNPSDTIAVAATMRTVDSTSFLGCRILGGISSVYEPTFGTYALEALY